MWINNRIVKEDLEYINSCNFIPWDKLRNKTIFVTGATGLIGQNLINGLLYANIKRNLNLKVIGLVRDIRKANDKYKMQLQYSDVLSFIVGDVRTFVYPKENVDFIVHGACVTASKDFVEKPEEVKNVAIKGTKHLLELARLKNVSSFVYLSSMEVYGYPKKEHICTEDESYNFDENDPRNSYPIAKLECERLCKEYYEKFHIPTKIIRLAQTFGPGVEYEDKRVFMEFARCIIEKKDIILLTKGETKRSYIYTADSVTAILTVLMVGISGEIYNVANSASYISIASLAEKFISFSVGSKIVYRISNNVQYLKTVYYNLSTKKLMELNYKSNYNIDLMVSNLINYEKDEK